MEYIKKNYNLESLNWISKELLKYNNLIRKVEDLQTILQKLENESSVSLDKKNLETINSQIVTIASLTEKTYQQLETL